MKSKFQSVSPVVRQYKAKAIESYCIALIGPVDPSEFIILMLGLIQQLINKPEEEKQSRSNLELELQKIRVAYLITDYETALQCIKNIVEQHSSKINEAYHKLIDGKTISQLILNKLENPLLDIDIYTNHSRRFFENRLSAIYIYKRDHFQASLVASLDRVSRFLFTKPVKSIQDVKRAINLIANTSREEGAELEILKSKTSLYSKKDRRRKNGIDSKIGTIFSRNRGVLTSNSPNFFNEISGVDLKNRVPDRGYIIGNPRGYSLTNKRHAFAGSISGHAYSAIFNLRRYMICNGADINLSNDINLILEALVFEYIHLGYHSYAEMMDVFSQAEILFLFKLYDVNLDLEFAHQYLEEALNETRQYTKTLCLKRTMSDELYRERYLEDFCLALQENNMQKVLLILENIPSNLLVRFLISAELDLPAGKQLAQYAGTNNATELELALVQINFNFFSEKGIDYGKSLLEAILLFKKRELPLNDFLREAIIAHPNSAVRIAELTSRLLLLQLLDEKDICKTVLTNLENSEFLLDCFQYLKEYDLLNNAEFRAAVLSKPDEADELSCCILLLCKANLHHDKDLRDIILYDSENRSNLADAISSLWCEKLTHLFQQNKFRQDILSNPGDADKVAREAVKLHNQMKIGDGSNPVHSLSFS